MQEQDDENIPNIERQGWSAEKISEEAANKEPDEIVRQMKRGDETKAMQTTAILPEAPKNRKLRRDAKKQKTINRRK